nr:MAG TPA: hypothetical protein [Inoviridae sp.]
MPKKIVRPVRSLAANTLTTSARSPVCRSNGPAN